MDADRDPGAPGAAGRRPDLMRWSHEPVRLRAAVARVRAEHGGRARRNAAGPAGPDSLSLELRRMVERSGGPPPERVDRLDPDEIEALARLLPRLNDRIRERTLEILARRPNPRIGPILWNLLQVWPQDRALHRAVRAAAVPHGWNDLIPRSLARWVARGLNRADLAAGLVGWLGVTGTSLAAAWGDPANRLENGTPLVEQVFRRLLTDGTVDQIRREDPDAVFYGVDRLLDRHQKRQFARGYLAGLTPETWDLRILEVLARTFGDRSRGDMAFWLSLDHRLERAVTRRRLAGALQSWPDREAAAWWGLRQGLVVTLWPPGPGGYLLLDLGSLMVAEFGRDGGTSWLFPARCRDGLVAGAQSGLPDDAIWGQALLRLSHRGDWTRILEERLADHGLGRRRE